MGHETWWEEPKSIIESETKKTKTREIERHKEERNKRAECQKETSTKDVV